MLSCVVPCCAVPCPIPLTLCQARSTSKLWKRSCRPGPAARVHPVRPLVQTNVKKLWLLGSFEPTLVVFGCTFGEEIKYSNIVFDMHLLRADVPSWARCEFQYDTSGLLRWIPFGSSFQTTTDNKSKSICLSSDGVQATVQVHLADELRLVFKSVSVSISFKS